MPKQRTYIIGHKKPDTDTISSAIGYAKYKNKTQNEKYVPARAGELNPETQYVLKKFNVQKPNLLKSLKDKKVILVDHNEFSQSVDGIEQAKLEGVLDHHRISKPESQKPIYFHTEPVGSTSTMVAEKLLRYGELEKSLAGILLSAILSDTVVHRSPTNTKKDEEIANKLAEMLDINIEEYGREMLEKKSKIGEKTPREIVLGDFKEYEMANRSVSIGQVETVSPQQVLEKKEKILDEMNDIIKERKYDLLLLLVTDLLEEDSEAFVVGETKRFEEAFGERVEQDSAFLEGVLSRKKQVVPKIRKQFN
ncbi:manganese-dependent inorganic pyrophosphatase [archaeon SCG-AAA382B04]|nr:manganese-dependent inorganic pyrophosphatase [archaeon SCG-AAA382B04]